MYTIANSLKPLRSCSLCPPDVGLLPCCLFWLFQTSGVYYSIESEFVNPPKPLSTLKISRDTPASFAAKHLKFNTGNALDAISGAAYLTSTRKKNKDDTASCFHPSSFSCFPNDSPGTRTPNLGIKSALLCQLS